MAYEYTLSARKYRAKALDWRALHIRVSRARRLPLLLIFAVVTVVDVDRKSLSEFLGKFWGSFGYGFPAIYVESYRRS